MKKIAIMHYAYPPNIGGVEILVKEQANILTKLGYQVTVLTGEGEESNPKIKLIKIPEFQSILNINPNLQNNIIEKGIIDDEFYRMSKKIEEILAENLKEIDTVIIHNMLTVYRNLPFIYAFRKYIKKNPNKKVIVWVHDHMYIGEEKVKTLFLEKKDTTGKTLGKNQLEIELLTHSLPQAKYIIISETFKNLLLQVMSIPKENVYVIPNGIDLKKILEIDRIIWKIVENHQLLKAFPFIISPVNILERKNIEYSLEIIWWLKKDFPNIKYLITGRLSKHRNTTNYLIKLEQLINKLKIQDEVIFLQKEIKRALENSEIHDLYSLSDLIFYFSKSENFGLPILEAALTKTPIFISNLKVFYEVIDDLVNFIDYNNTNPKKASEIIKSFIEKNKIIKSNYLVRTKYDLETIIKNELIPLL